MALLLLVATAVLLLLVTTLLLELARMTALELLARMALELLAGMTALETRVTILSGVSLHDDKSRKKVKVASVNGKWKK